MQTFFEIYEHFLKSIDFFKKGKKGKKRKKGEEEKKET